MTDQSLELSEKTSVFPERVDHIYCVSIDATETEPDNVYIGQSVTPGRALKHFKSHNGRLQQRLAHTSSWTISFQSLARASAEDLNIFESLAIDIISHDHRFNSLNGSLGAQIFRPRSFYPEENLPVKNGVYVLWEYSNGHNQVVEVTDLAPVHDPSTDTQRKRWWVTPSLHPENIESVVEGIESLLQTVATNESVTLQSPYFQYLGEMGLQPSYRLPASGGMVELGDLYEELKGSFIYVQINDQVFEQPGNIRGGLKPGLDHNVLQDRLEKFWHKGSSSQSGTRTISKLLTYQDRVTLPEHSIPRYLVGVVSGSRVVLGIWNLDALSSNSWLDDETGKVIFPIQAAADPRLLNKFVGARIGSKLSLNSKAVKWIDVMP
ncbi:hypothetical protein [Glutamicibacter nicotianae]|uniref:hypothetical protein n=1 Tax=Glutamicibacter nicotianae TaxID=37929 RepID=UPI001959A9C4|nr:hypothetical protein [Glutamicibacter nicotianae]MBM7769107.1 hypothetical protein [Glutamicibacter nicotianae]